MGVEQTIGWSNGNGGRFDLVEVTASASHRRCSDPDLRSAPLMADRKHQTVRASLWDRVRAVRRGAGRHSAFRCGFGTNVESRVVVNVRTAAGVYAEGLKIY
jgi:hypothetical protein